MSTSDYFAGSYFEARQKFLAAANRAGSRLSAYLLPDYRGPEDEDLAVDVATLGPSNATSALLLISATHGVEGFCGSGCQTGYLVDRLYEVMPPHTTTILIHALNPYGFAWLRRVNEDNIDLNRNFQDFSKMLPSSSAYEVIHNWLVPEDWDGPDRRAADLALHKYMNEHGMAAFQAAVSGGQYTCPNGLFYGGTRESWSNRTFQGILKDNLVPTVTRLIALDFHTGLGPTSYGEPIYTGSPDEGFERAKKWFGPEVTCTDKGTSTSAVVTGPLTGAIGGMSPNVEVTALALEYGTKQILDILTALRADHWLHAVPDRQTSLREQVKRDIRDAFYVDTPAWKAAVYGRAADFVMRAGRALFCT
ncbi:MAG TPA: M14 family metallopeptidase [Gemmataceae bacterium]|jgi:hypothetical protein